MTATISQVEVFPVGMPLVGTFTSSGASHSITRCVVVRVTAADGAVGISFIRKQLEDGARLYNEIRSVIEAALDAGAAG